MQVDKQGARMRLDAMRKLRERLLAWSRFARNDRGPTEAATAPLRTRNLCVLIGPAPFYLNRMLLGLPLCLGSSGSAFSFHPRRGIDGRISARPDTALRLDLIDWNPLPGAAEEGEGLPTPEAAPAALPNESLRVRTLRVTGTFAWRDVDARVELVDYGEFAVRSAGRTFATFEKMIEHCAATGWQTAEGGEPPPRYDRIIGFALLDAATFHDSTEATSTLQVLRLIDELASDLLRIEETTCTTRMGVALGGLEPSLALAEGAGRRPRDLLRNVAALHDTLMHNLTRGPDWNYGGANLETMILNFEARRQDHQSAWPMLLSAVAVDGVLSSGAINWDLPGNCPRYDLTVSEVLDRFGNSIEPHYTADLLLALLFDSPTEAQLTSSELLSVVVSRRAAPRLG